MGLGRCHVRTTPASKPVVQGARGRPNRDLPKLGKRPLSRNHAPVLSLSQRGSCSESSSVFRRQEGAPDEATVTHRMPGEGDSELAWGLLASRG